jgi:hypothetical protein
MFYASNVIGLETINYEVLKIVIVKLDPQFCSGNLTGSVAATPLELFFSFMQPYKATKDVCNLMLTNKNMLNIVKKVIKREDEHRENLLNFFGESWRKNLRDFYEESKLILFTGFYRFSFNQEEKKCMLSLQLIRNKNFFRLNQRISTIDSSLNVQDFYNRSFSDRWCHRDKLTDHWQCVLNMKIVKIKKH